MESQPENTEFRNNPGNVHHCIINCKWLLFKIIMFFQLLNFKTSVIKGLYMKDIFQQPK